MAWLIGRGSSRDILVAYERTRSMCCGHFNRREFLGVTTGLAASVGLAGPTTAIGAGVAGEAWNPRRAFTRVGKPLRIKPILMYHVAHRREMASWKSWGGVQTDEAAEKEARRITKELSKLASEAALPIEVLPIAKVTSADQAEKAREGKHDAVIVYPATGSGSLLRACVAPDKHTIIFVRHRSGPVYYWYEALSVKYLKTDDAHGESGRSPAANLSVHDVVVDDYQEMLWRLRGLYGVTNLLGSKIVALGGPAGKYARDAPQVARERFGIDIIDVSYKELGRRIEAAMVDTDLLSRAGRWTDKYLAMPHTQLMTDKRFVINAFVL